ncbi:MAG: tripartite tricarboxylate transporter substrate-binding protein [Variovorax sp.]
MAQPQTMQACRRHILGRLLLSGALLLAASPPLLAQLYPSRPVTVIVPFAPGGGIDAVARQLTALLAADLGQTVVVENVTGAFGTIGTQKVARSAPDGHTLLFVVSSPLNVAPLLTPSAVRYDTFKDFAPIATVGMLPFALVGRNDLQADSLDALVRLAKAAPGKLNFGTDGTGSLLHITGELIKQRAGIDLVHVPYKAGPQVLTDIVGGQLDLGILPVALVQPLVRDGRVRAFGVTSSARIASLAQVPALSESASFEGVALESWMGLLAPAGTPQAIVDRLAASVRKATSNAAMERQLEERGVKPRFVSEGAFADLLRQERKLISDVVSRTGMKPE